MVTHSAHCWTGDNTLSGIREGVQSVSQRTAALGDEATGFVLAMSDANLQRYGIKAEALDMALTSEPQVQACIVLLGSLGNEATDVASKVPGGRAVVCSHTSILPGVVRQFLEKSAVRDNL